MHFILKHEQRVTMKVQAQRFAVSPLLQSSRPSSSRRSLGSCASTFAIVVNMQIQNNSLCLQIFLCGINSAGKVGDAAAGKPQPAHHTAEEQHGYGYGYGIK